MKYILILFLLFNSKAYSYDSQSSRNALEPKDQANFLGNIKSLMRYTNQRHKVLSENVANANIPRAQAKDLVSFKKIRKNAVRLKMSTTSAAHFKNTSHRPEFKAFLDKEADTITPNGNNIDLFQQSIKIEENTDNMKKANKLYKQYSKLRKTAIGDRAE